MVVNAFGYASVHAFYPNMSKFFRTRFGYSNIDAGHISAIPYLIASLLVPFLGSLTGYLGEGYFELMLFYAIAMILVVHVCYLSLSDVAEDGAVGGYLTVLPLLPFGIGHALFTTMQAPMVPKLVKNENHLPRVFTYIKITESIGITLFVYIAGYIRQTTGCFTMVSFMMLGCTMIAMTAIFFLMNETKAIGANFISLATLSENLELLKKFVQKLFKAQQNGASEKVDAKKEEAQSDED